jgi:hypothetical protein
VIDYDKLEEVAGRIESGDATIARLNRQEEQGRSRGGRIAIEASILAGRVGRPIRAGQGEFNQDNEVKQEVVLRNYAKERGVLKTV